MRCRAVLALASLAAALGGCAGGGAGGADAAAPPPACTPVAPPTPPSAGQPWRLSEALAFTDLKTRTPACGLVEYEPAHTLWSDGSDKRRWLQLPPGTKIDTADMNHWRFPVGTRAFKEFGRAGRPLETRLIQRVGPGDAETDFLMGAFVWLADGSDAVWTPDGAVNALGTDHDVPAAEKCGSCHKGEPGRFLGISAVQASAPAKGLTLEALRRGDLLSAPPPASASFAPPGPPEVRRALGYLHANCGHCHHMKGPAWRDTDMVLRLFVDEQTPEATAVYRSTLGLDVQKFRSPEVSKRVIAGRPDASAVLVRMRSREKEVGMPPLATKHADLMGVELVRAWIAGL